MSSPVPASPERPAAIRPLTVFTRPPASPAIPEEIDPWGGGERGASPHEGIDDAVAPGPAAPPAAVPDAARPDTPPDLSGTVLHDRYELVRRIGRGGMGEVYEAIFLPSGQRVAVKLLSERLAESEEMLKRFRHELRALEAIRHPSIVTARDFCTAGGRPYLVMEFVEGEDLSRRSKRPALEVARIGMGACEALEAMHARGIVHRDLSRRNIIARGEGREVEVTIIDLGVSKLTALYYAQGHAYQTPPGQRVHTRTGFAFGTPGYMAPEVFAGEAACPRQDVYSLGVVLYELLVGAKPPQAWMIEIPGDVDHEALGLAALTWQVILKAIEPDPAVRYQSAASFREALEDLLLNVDDDAPEPIVDALAPIIAAPAPAPAPIVAAPRPIIAAPAPIVAEASGATDAPGRWPALPEASPPRRSMGWTVAAILVLYMIVDRIVRLEGAPPEVVAPSPGAVDPATPLASPPSVTPPPTPLPADDRPPSTMAVEASSPAPPDVAAATTTAIEVAEVTEVAEETSPRPRRRPLTAAAFREIAVAKRVALDRCGRRLRGGPPVDAIVRVSADGSTRSVRLSPDVSYLAQSCASEVFEGLHFPRADRASTHTWPLYRAAGREE